MDHVFGRQRSGRSNSGSSCTHRAVLIDPLVRLLLDDRATGRDDRCCHPATVLKVLVGGVDDGVHILSGQITLHHLQHSGIVTMVG